MNNIFPRHEIDFVGIQTIDAHYEVISASQVRQLFEKGDFKQIAELVLLTTLEFLKKQYQEKEM